MTWAARTARLCRRQQFPLSDPMLVPAVLWTSTALIFQHGRGGHGAGEKPVMVMSWAGLAQGASSAVLPSRRGSAWRNTEWDILLWQQQPLKSAEPWSVNLSSESSRNLPDSFYKANTAASVCPFPEVCQDHVSDNVHSSNSDQSPLGSGSFLIWTNQTEHGRTAFC